MKFQTSIPVKAQRFNQITYDSSLLLIGSCFAQHMGDQFSYYKFKNVLNPFGIVFSPPAIEHLITNCINGKRYESSDLFQHLERYHCFDAHSELSQANAEDVLKALNDAVQLTGTSLKSASHILLTFGTAWVYRHIATDRYVANCHKIPQNQFLKELISVEHILESLESTYQLIKSVNPNCQMILTVSPVRHLKDGFIENTRSKAHLISALHQLEENENDCHYFPSYEILLDELRDYRFYNEDMLHPSPIAVCHIWEKFQTAWIDDSALATMDTIDTIQKGLHHRPFNPDSQAHRAFLSHLETLKSSISAKYAHISF